MKSAARLTKLEKTTMPLDDFQEPDEPTAEEEREAVLAGRAGSAVWLPITSAPRGETVLLYVSNAFGHKHVKTGIAYPTGHPDLGIVSIFDDGDSLGYLPEKHARYWMPLPSFAEQRPR